MLNDHHESAARHKPAPDRDKRTLEILDVVEGEDADNDVDGLRLHLCVLGKRLDVGDRVVVRALSRNRKHLFGRIDSDDVRRSLRACEAAKEAFAAAEVNDAFAVDVRDNLRKHRLHDVLVQPDNVVTKVPISREKLGVVKDVLLRHAAELRTQESRPAQWPGSPFANEA